MFIHSTQLLPHSSKNSATVLCTSSLSVAKQKECAKALVGVLYVCIIYVDTLHW